MGRRHIQTSRFCCFHLHCLECLESFWTSTLHVLLSTGPVGQRTYRGHYSQILTGFSLLARQGRIRLSQRMGGTGVQAQVNGIKLYYDVLDGPEIDTNLLEWCDYYFKRSYAAQYMTGYRHSQRIVPLGLNYEVYGNGPDWANAWRALHNEIGLTARMKGFTRALRLNGSFRPTVSAMLPRHVSTKTTVIFLTQVWSAEGHDHPVGPDVHEMNATRAACIGLLKKRFGERALVGFSRTSLAEQLYPDLIADVNTSKEAYFSYLQGATIGISTTGLFGSNPWKLGEYVAFGKVIVSEPLVYPVPGFNAGEHYLEFRSAEECADLVQQLFDEPDLRDRIAASNVDYYRQLLRPDQLVMRSLQYAMRDASRVRIFSQGDPVA